jgi:hypothetical protein
MPHVNMQVTLGVINIPHGKKVSSLTLLPTFGNIAEFQLDLHQLVAAEAAITSFQMA